MLYKTNLYVYLTKFTDQKLSNDLVTSCKILEDLVLLMIVTTFVDMEKFMGEAFLHTNFPFY